LRHVATRTPHWHRRAGTTFAGDKLGNVADLLVDSEATRIVGLVMSAGVFSSERVLPYEDVTAVGRDAVVTRSGNGVVRPREWRVRGVDAERTSAPRTGA
jgi:uncharacterized protein YrrD